MLKQRASAPTDAPLPPGRHVRLLCGPTKTHAKKNSKSVGRNDREPAATTLVGPSGEPPAGLSIQIPVPFYVM